MNSSKYNLSFEERKPIAVLIKFGAGFDDIKNEFERRFNKPLRVLWLANFELKIYGSWGEQS